MAKMGTARAAVAGQIGNGISSLLFGLLPLITTNEYVLFLGFTVFRLACVPLFSGVCACGTCSLYLHLHAANRTGMAR